MSLRNVRILLLALLALEAALLLFGPQARDHLPAIQSALAANGKPEWWDDAAMGLRYAAWINIGLLILLLVTSKWWTRPFSKSPISNLKSQILNSRWFWPLAILAMLTCLGLRLPLASKSLWWDESWVMFQAVHGKWRPDSKQPGQLKFQPHDWKRCAFYYQKPTNHVPMSLAQKASLSVWRKLSGAGRGEFSDLAARTPALIASCAAVLLLALLLRSWGWPGAGAAAAFLLALHPWHVRYGVDARAYAFVVPLCIAGMFAVSRIWQSRGAAVSAVGRLGPHRVPLAVGLSECRARCRRIECAARCRPLARQGGAGQRPLPAHRDESLCRHGLPASVPAECHAGPALGGR